MITKSRNANIANRCLELDQRMSLVVRVGWTGLTNGTEIGVVADSTFVTISSDISGRNVTIIILGVVLVFAQRPITENAMVTNSDRLLSSTGAADRFIERYKSVTLVNEGSIRNACITVIPIWTIKALVTNTKDGSITSITNSRVRGVTTCGEKGRGHWTKVSIFIDESESVLRVVTMLQ